MAGITLNLEGMENVKRKLASVTDQMSRVATQQAINKTLTKAKTETVRRVAADYRVLQSEVRASVTTNKANRRQAVTRAYMEIFGSPSKRGRSMNLIRYIEKFTSLASARKLAKLGKLPQLRFKFKKNRGAKSIDGAFIGNRGRTVFIRTGNARLPIKPVQIIGISQMFSSRKIDPLVRSKMLTDLMVELERSVKLAIQKNSK